jgi:hypothetical protein
MPEQSTVKPRTIALICAAAAGLLFVGSIVIGVAVVQAERAAPEQPVDSQPSNAQ